MYTSLEAALAEDGNPPEVLRQQLPGAVLAELAELDATWSDPEAYAELIEELRVRGVYKVLTNRVSNRLRKSHSEANELLKHGWKLAEPETPPAHEDFELRETARQQLVSFGTERPALATTN